MRTLHKTWTILAFGLLAAACGTTAKPSPQHGTAATTPTPADSEPSAFPAGGDAAPPPMAPVATATGGQAEGRFDEAESAPPPASPSPTSAGRGSGRTNISGEAKDDGASASRSAPKKSSRPLEPAPDRPGLGTTWGETMSSRVSNAPFERASGNPFSLTSIHYNDQLGISAMLRGSSPVAFRTDAAAIVGNGLLTVRLVDAGGSPLPTFATGGKSLAQGEVGQRYMIELSNRSANRFEAVVTVDGLDVIDGKPGSLAKRGYLVQPFATVNIDGFRQNMDEVAAFRFGSVRGSYAAQKGSDRNVGVIGVAVFAERGAQPWTDREISRRESADPFPGRFASPPIAR
jgi:hypothetical protein